MYLISYILLLKKQKYAFFLSEGEMFFAVFARYAELGDFLLVRTTTWAGNYS